MRRRGSAILFLGRASLSCLSSAHRVASSSPATRLSIHQRLELLCDANTFRPWSSARGAQPSETRPGLTAGTGRVFGRRVAILAHDGSLAGGAISCADADRATGLMACAGDEGIPLISLCHSAGAKIQEGVQALDGVASILQQHVALSGVVPQISLIVGPCAGGAAYAAALTDFTFMVQERGFLFVTGPAVARAVGGPSTSLAALGGAAMHAEVSGVSSGTFPDEVTAVSHVRRLLSYLPSNAGEAPPRVRTNETRDRSAAVLAHVLPAHREEAYDVCDVLSAVLDCGSFFPIQPKFAPNMVCGFGRLEGRSVCVIANQPSFRAGVIDSNASTKAARLVRFADAFNIPILTFADVPGFLPGVEEESGGIIRHGAKLLYAYGAATVPRLTVILRKAYGGAYIVMSSKQLGGDRNYMWPQADIAVMGTNAASSIIGGGPQPVTESRSPGSGDSIDAVIRPENTRAQLCKDLDDLTGCCRTRRGTRRHGNSPL